MIRHPRIHVGLLWILLLLAACAPDAAESPAEVQATAPGVQEMEATALPAATPAATATSGETAATAPEPTEATAEPTEMSPATAPAEGAAPEPEEADVTINGRTDDGAYFLGRADAPLTIIDYSDFL